MLLFWNTFEKFKFKCTKIVMSPYARMHTSIISNPKKGELFSFQLDLYPETE